MKKILVPTDFSKEAEQATRVAAKLAKKNDCELVLVHMLDLPTNNHFTKKPASPMPEVLFFMKLAQKKFEDLLAMEFLKGISVKEMVDFQEMSQGIMTVCKSENIDLIIMGSHGADGLKEMFIGSNAEKVVRISNVPVMVIKNEHTDFEINNFVFASDFNNDNKETYNQAVKLAQLFEAKLHLLMVITGSNFITTAKAKTRISDFTSINSFKNYTTNIYNDNSIEEGVLNFSHINNTDLIGISTHGRQGIAHFFNGSISEDLVNHAKRPVITFKI
ncbi:universal stress protein [Aurantibacter sp.]|uniref:universal stress protein n=1 Tax=Aurantibacter sp. TaxID=2807103 RepID=UPI0035C7E64A